MYILVTAGSLDSCSTRTDYGTNTQCQGTVVVSSLAELDEYIVNDFGRKDNRGCYQNLGITTSLKDSVLIIESPCEINLGSSVILTGDFIRVDGRGGVIANNFDAENVCVLSETKAIEIRPGAVITVHAITMQAAQGVTIDDDASIDVSGSMVIASTGNGHASTAEIKAGAIVRAGSLSLDASYKAALDEGILLTTTGALSLKASETASDSVAEIGVGTQIQAAELTLRSGGQAVIDKDTDITVFGNLSVESTGTASKSLASIKTGSQVVVNGDTTIQSGNKVALEKNTAVSVTGNFHLDAARCQVQKPAMVTAGSKSGKCF